MEIKKTKNGWEYAGIVFTDEESARRVQEASEKDNSLPANFPKSPQFELKYDGERPTSFGSFVTDYLKKNDKTIVAFAEEIGVSRQTLFNWMSGISLPTGKHAAIIKEVMNCTALQLIEALEDNFQYPKLKMLEELKRA